MIRVTFTALRELTGTHLEGDSVTLSFSSTDLTPSRVVSRNVQKAIGGQRETLRYNSLRQWAVTTEPLANETLDAVIEFLCSCEGGEAFSFDPMRQETGPSLDLDFVTPRLRVAESANCILDSEGYTVSRLLAMGTGGPDDWYQVSFTAQETP